MLRKYLSAVEETLDAFFALPLPPALEALIGLLLHKVDKAWLEASICLDAAASTFGWTREATFFISDKAPAKEGDIILSTRLSLASASVSMAKESAHDTKICASVAFCKMSRAIRRAPNSTMASLTASSR